MNVMLVPHSFENRYTAAKFFKEQAIELHHTAVRVDAQDEEGSIEIDILIENTNEVLAVEVTSRLEV